jgi:uncharacterized HAD superfamily protein
MKYTAADKYREAADEVAFRRSVYKNLVRDNRMTQAEAERKIGIMEEIAQEYRAQGEPQLFDEAQA